MSNTHSCDCLVLGTPLRRPARWGTMLNVIALVLEAFEEAWAMHRAMRQKYPFDNE